MTMNLPGSATEFLDAFRGTFRRSGSEGGARPLPMVHCYTFVRVGEAEVERAKALAVEAVEAGLGGEVGEECEAYVVRDVAPNKVMACVSFRLPEAIAYGDGLEVRNEAAGAAGGRKRKTPDGDE